MNALYHRGIITPLPAQVDSYLTLYGFRITEQYDDIVTLIRDPVTLSGLSTPFDGLTWNLDHYPATHEGTRQLERDLTQWEVSDHDRMVLLLTHQERYGAVVAHFFFRDGVGTLRTLRKPHVPSPVEMG